MPEKQPLMLSSDLTHMPFIHTHVPMHTRTHKHVPFYVTRLDRGQHLYSHNYVKAKHQLNRNLYLYSEGDQKGSVHHRQPVEGAHIFIFHGKNSGEITEVVSLRQLYP